VEYIIGVDIGTSGLKLQSFGKDGTPINSTYQELNLIKENDRAEQSVSIVTTALMKSLSHLIKNATGECVAIVFSSAMHSLILLDDNKKCLTKSITWADQRAGILAEDYRATAEGLKMFTNTGTPIHAMSPLMKICWFKENAQPLFYKAAYFIGIKEYITYQLTGELVMDTSIASATGLFNIHSGNWDHGALTKAGIKEAQLPKLVSPHEKLELLESIRKELGLSAKCRLIAGASDGCLANFGAGILDDDSAILTIGTSAAVRINLKQVKTDPNGELFTYWLDANRLIMGGASNNGGIVLHWFENYIQNRFLINELFEMISDHDFYDEDLLFFPWVYGERAPLWTSKSNFGFINRNEKHQIGHLFQSVLEGIAFNIKWIFEILEYNKKPIKKVVFTGGLTKAQYFSQLIADTLDKELIVSQEIDASLIGAIKIGFEALKWDFKNQNSSSEIKVFQPTNSEKFLIKYARFRAAHAAGLQPKIKFKV
jgi:gluconokinase